MFALEVSTAFTRTAVGTVPACSTALTVPSDALIALVDANAMPPAVVVGENVTAWLASGFPFESRTLKTTVEFSWPPMPRIEIVVGVAETNWIDEAVDVTGAADTE